MAGHDRRGSIGVCTTSGEGDPTCTTPNGARNRATTGASAVVVGTTRCRSCRHRETPFLDERRSAVRQTVKAVHGASGHKKDISGDTGGIGVRKYGAAPRVGREADPDAYIVSKVYEPHTVRGESERCGGRHRCRGAGRPRPHINDPHRCF